MTQAWQFGWIAAFALVAGCVSSVEPLGDGAAPADGLAISDANADAAVDRRAAASCPVGMAMIPAGMFLMGDAMLDDPAAQPVHGVRLSAFCIDFTEVTVAAYRRCTAPGCTPATADDTCNAVVTGRDDHPINCVTWNQAHAYCQFVGGDLPTEAQWEYAARGSDGRPYPWGSDAPGAQVCWSGGGTSRSSTCPVGSFPGGRSPFGVLDMAGNVFEWTADSYEVYSDSPDAYVMDPTGPANGVHRSDRGGGWHDTVEVDERSAVRSNAIPMYLAFDLGFRCAHAPM